MMLENPTRDRLRELRLNAMVEEWDRQTADAEVAGLSFEDRLGLLVDAEWTTRSNRRLHRRVQEAHLRLLALPEDLDWRAPRGLDAPQVRSLLKGAWIPAHQTVVITGPTGVGKTFVLCALGYAACRQDFRVGYFRLARLFGDAALARAEGRWLRWLQRLARYDLLLLDDWGLDSFGLEAGQDLLEIIDDRYQVKATAIASQTPVDQWHGLFQDPTVADAVLDRLVHHAHHLTMRGESMRKVLPNRETNGTTNSTT